MHRNIECMHMIITEMVRYVQLPFIINCDTVNLPDLNMSQSCKHIFIIE